MGQTYSTQHPRPIQCQKGSGMCVAVKRGLVVVSDFNTQQLHVHSLADGSWVRSFGSKGRCKGQFRFQTGMMCVGANGDSILVAERDNNRVQEVRICDGSWVRYIGPRVLGYPLSVDCNADVIVVSEELSHRISVFSWCDRKLLKQFGSEFEYVSLVNSPIGIRVLHSGNIVVQNFPGPLCVFTPSGELVTGLEWDGFYGTHDVVVHTDSDGSLVLANPTDDEVITMSCRDGNVTDVCGGAGKFDQPSALAVLPDGGLVVREFGINRCQVFSGLLLRQYWAAWVLVW